LLRTRTARVIWALMRSGRDRRSENPGWVMRGKSACFCLGPISGSHQGQRSKRPHSKAEYMTAPERFVDHKIPLAPRAPSIHGRVEMWRGGSRLNISVSAPFVWRCLSSSTVTPFPHPAHRTGQADFPHPALGQELTPSPTARCAQARSGVRARSARKDAGVDRSRPCVA